MQELEKITLKGEIPRRPKNQEVGKIYLYIKISPKNLFYLGKFTNKNYNTHTVHHYLGSGKRWLRHIKKNNYSYQDIRTIILHEGYDMQEIITLGLYYSNLFNVVKSKLWANIIPESGQGAVGYVQSLEQRLTTSEFCKKNETYKRLHTPEARLKSKQNVFYTDEMRHKARVNLNTPEAIEKRRKNTNYKDPERIRKIVEKLDYKKLSENNSKILLQYCLKGFFIKEWKSIAEASRSLGLSSGTLSSSASGRLDSFGGFMWKFKNGDIEETLQPYIDGSKKAVLQYSKDLNFIKEWDSAVTAGKSLGINKGNISNCCRGRERHATAGGFIWRFKN